MYCCEQALLRILLNGPPSLEQFTHIILNDSQLLPDMKPWSAETGGWHYLGFVSQNPTKSTENEDSKDLIQNTQSLE